jgi:osmoprotectant transport system permease protein
MTGAAVQMHEQQPAALSGVRIDPVLLLGAALGLLAVWLPWVNFRPNRLVQGEGQALFSLALGARVWLPAAWLGLVALGFWPRRWSGSGGSPLLRLGLQTVLFAAVAGLTSALIGQAASVLMAQATPFARVSPAGGAWLSLAALYVTGFALSQAGAGAAKSASRWASLCVLTAAALFLAVPVLGGWAKLGLALEYANISDTFGPQLGTHVALSLISLALAALVGFPLGIAAARNSQLEGGILGFSSFLQTVPSVALFGLILPVFSALGRQVNVGSYLLVAGAALLGGWALTRTRSRPLTGLGGLVALLGAQGLLLLVGLALLQLLQKLWLGGDGLSREAFSLAAPLELWGVRGIGFAPALFALTLYGLLPIVVNTFVGLKSVPHGISDAAKGMGLTPTQVLFRAELPVALPFLLEGLRNGLVLTFGITTIAALIGAGGLGFFIQRGVEGNVPDLVLLGAVPIVLMALLLDGLMRGVSALLTPPGLRIAADPALDSH